MNIEVIEIVLIAIIIFIQIKVFSGTYKKIRLFKGIIPEITKLCIQKISVPLPDLENLRPAEIIDNIEKYKDHYKYSYNPKVNSEVLIGASSEEDFEGAESQQTSVINKLHSTDHQPIELGIIEQESSSNSVFDKIIQSINIYLIRNKGAVSDFNLLKDIIERNTDAQEEDINLTISIPLYLGLMGTMLGIVIGLFYMFFLSGKSNDNLGGGISVLLGGVSIAMIASFCGLLFTVINSGLYFKGSKSLIETRKNDLYTFIQIELLPVISQNITSTFVSLQRNLFRFNKEFSFNLSKLSGLFTSNYDALKTQERVLTSLEKIDISQVAKYNITVLKQLQTSTQEFEKFNIYLNNINSFVENSNILSNKLSSILARTDNFNDIAKNIENKLEQSETLLEFLQTHFKDLEDRKQVIQNAVINVDDAINDSINQLKEHTQNSISRVKEFTIDEADALKSALKESRTNLGNLTFLESINDEIKALLASSIKKDEITQSIYKDLVSKIEDTNRLLTQLGQNNMYHYLKNISKWLSIRK